MSVPAELLLQVMTEQGTISTDRLSQVLHITKTELALATGLSRDAVSKRDRLASRQTQARLRDTVEIMQRVAHWTGSVGRAFAWFRAQPLTLVAYRVSCGRVADLTEAQILAVVEIEAETLAGPWEALASQGLRPPTWNLAQGLMDAGIQGALVPSFAPGTGTEDRNLVLWHWSKDGALPGPGDR